MNFKKLAASLMTFGLLAAFTPGLALAGYSDEIQIEGRITRMNEKFVWLETAPGRTQKLPRAWFGKLALRPDRRAQIVVPVHTYPTFRDPAARKSPPAQQTQPKGARK